MVALLVIAAVVAVVVFQLLTDIAYSFLIFKGYFGRMWGRGATFEWRSPADGPA